MTAPAQPSARPPAPAATAGPAPNAVPGQRADPSSSTRLEALAGHHHDGVDADGLETAWPPGAACCRARCDVQPPRFGARESQRIGQRGERPPTGANTPRSNRPISPAARSPSAGRPAACGTDPRSRRWRCSSATAMAVGARAEHRLRGHDAARAGLVVHHHRLAQRTRQAFSPARAVGSATPPGPKGTTSERARSRNRVCAPGPAPGGAQPGQQQAAPAG